MMLKITLRYMLLCQCVYRPEPFSVTIHRLHITQFRNLDQVSLEPSPHVNIIHGKNGSGKTNILEAIFFLTHGRSYKASKNASLVQRESAFATVFANIGDSQLPVGIQRDASGSTEVRIAGEAVTAISELASLVPLQFIHSEAFQILEGSPKYRRQFIDWGVFHVEHAFISAWRNTQKALKNRNTLLRSGRMDANELASWNQEFVSNANLVDQARSRYLEGFKQNFNELIDQFSDLPKIDISYSRGWDKTKTLDEVLADSLIRDKKSGFTHSGPQRADIRVRVDKENVSDILSRGQQKMVVSAMKLAQGHYLIKSKQQKRCIYLLDDLPAELDSEHLLKICRVLEAMDAQVFISCIDPKVLEDCWEDKQKVKMFHVEHGVLS